MDRTTKVQISYIVIGLFLIALPFLMNSFYYHFMLFYALWSIGVLLVLNGIIYKTTVKLSKKKKDAFEYREGIPKTDVEILGYVGLAVMLASFVLGLLKIGGTSVSILLFFVLLAVGMLMMLVSNILVRKQKLREIKKAKYGH